MAMPGAVPITRLVSQLQALGVVEGDVILVHTSFRAVRPVENGSAGLIEALTRAVGDRGTVVMPCWSDNDDIPFDPDTAPAARDLGAVAETFRQLPGVRRSSHPFAFVARGPAASAILADDLPLPPHRPESPVGRVREHDGKILLLGTDHDSNTTLHLAEVLAGVPYAIAKYITVMRDGRAIRIDYTETDHCCERFTLLNDWLGARGLQAEGTVGQAQTKLVRASDVIALAEPALERDPFLFLHPRGSVCRDCDAAWDSVSR